MKVIILLEHTFQTGPAYCAPATEIKGIYPWGPNGARAAKAARGKLEAQHSSGTRYELIIRSTEDCTGFAIPQFAVTGEFYLEDKDEKLWGYKTSVGEWEKLRVSWSNCGEGYSGDYDPDDPEDENLLRLDVQNEDEFLYSACTLFPASASAEQQKEALWMIARAIQNDPENLERVCERMTYIHLDEFGEPTHS